MTIKHTHVIKAEYDRKRLWVEGESLYGGYAIRIWDEDRIGIEFNLSKESVITLRDALTELIEAQEQPQESASVPEDLPF